jgi:hypothetical protein
MKKNGTMSPIQKNAIMIKRFWGDRMGSIAIKIGAMHGSRK